MKLRGRRLFFAPLLIAVVVLLGSTAALADQAMDALAKQTGKQLRNVERMMHSGKTQEALTLLNESALAIEQIKSNDPTNKKLRSLEQKYTRTKKSLHRKTGASAKAAAPLPASGEAAFTERERKDLTRRLKQINLELQRAEERIADERYSDAQSRLAKVEELFKITDRKYAQELLQAEKEYVDAVKRNAAVKESVGVAAAATAKAKEDAKIAKAGAEANNKALTDEWLGKFSPYIAGAYFPAGHKPEKQLLFPGTSEPEKFAAMDQVYQELKGVYQQFLQSPAANVTTWPLTQAATDVRLALENYESSMKSGKESIRRDAESQLDQALTYLTSDSGWKNDTTVMPPIVDSKRMAMIQSMVNESAKGFPAGAPELASLKKKEAQLLAQDQEHRKIREERRRMRPEVYGGKDLKAIRKTAEKVSKKATKGAKVLRVTVYKEAWKEERVLEFTDTTKTATRYRITQMINAQVATKQGDKVLLHTLHIAQDKQSSGWGPLYGHVMHSEPMLEKNVKK